MKISIETLNKTFKDYTFSLLLNGNDFINGFPKKLIASNLKLNLTPDPFQFISEATQDLYGFLGYDLKNSIEKLKSENKDELKFSEALFFTPQFEVEFDEIEINNINLKHEKSILKCSFSKEEYIEIINKIKKSIIEGNVYEVNFCIEFYTSVQNFNPIEVYLKLNSISPTPFSCLLKAEDKWLICASPERFIQKRGSKIISQPIKGTSKRNPDSIIDEKNKYDLQNSEKERAENLMIVDLVRNDLAKTAQVGTVKVEELFKIYSYTQVHQMISTISSEVSEITPISEIIKGCFPMGSMTGAPKIRCMEYIEELEKTKRGIFSGSVGYVTKSKDFDFNVVIRSMMYNESTQYLSFQVGSAITIDSNPEHEYLECLNKAEAIMKTLGYSS